MSDYSLHFVIGSMLFVTFLGLLTEMLHVKDQRFTRWRQPPKPSLF
jgi:hypothetical protein